MQYQYKMQKSSPLTKEDTIFVHELADGRLSFILKYTWLNVTYYSDCDIYGQSSFRPAWRTLKEAVIYTKWYTQAAINSMELPQFTNNKASLSFSK